MKNNKKKLTAAVCLLLAVLTLSSCGEKTTSADETAPETSVTTALTSESGEESQTVPTGESGTPTIPTETPVSSGESETDAGKTTASKTETPPAPVDPTGIRINEQDIEISVGENFTVTYTLLPAGATAKKIYWISENKTAFSVDENGVLTGLAAGQGYVTAYIDNGTELGLTAVSMVYVTDGEQPTTEPTTEPTPTETETPTEPTTETPDDNPLEYKHYEYTFKADLSDYEKYMDPETNEYLILVNADHPLTSKDIPSDLVEAVNTRKDGRDPAKMRLYAEKAMEALYLEAEAEGMLYENVVTVDGERYRKVLSITSAYRSYYDQEYVFNSYVERDAKLYPQMTLEEVKKEVSTYSCPPGTSEHQTGLCADMHNWPTAGRYMAKDFAESPAGTWLRDNCYKFGFILRFDEDKTDVTGITYESWHFRYVGRYHATKIHEMGLCLEEYVEYLAQYGYVIN